MPYSVVAGLLIPFFGTSAGAVCVWLMKDSLSRAVRERLIGFSAGIMLAASVWSLLLPAIGQSGLPPRWAFIPAAVGFGIGMLFLPLADQLLLPKSGQMPESTALLVLAVVLHNIPEGMAVGIAFAGCSSDAGGIAPSAAMMLSLGIAIQNIPEGAIISLPLAAEGISRCRAFGQGVMSGAVEPVAGMVTWLLSGLFLPMMPYMLGFAAGAMIYVVMAELAPALAQSGHRRGLAAFTVGFALMMALDVALG